MKKFYSNILIISILLLSVSLNAQEGRKWKLRGFLDNYNAIRYNSTELMSSRTRLRAEISKNFDNASVFCSLNAIYNPILRYKSGIYLREAYLNYHSDNWGFKAGKQIVIWGVSDGLKVTDVISPMDFTEFLAQDYDDIRVPVNAIRFFTYNENMKLELIAVPNFQSYILPMDDDNVWNINNIFYSYAANQSIPLLGLKAAEEPKRDLKNADFGARMSFNLPGIDFSLCALHTWNKMPVFVPKLDLQQTEMYLVPSYYRTTLIGFDFAKPLNQFVIRGEGAFNFNKHFGSFSGRSLNPEKGYSSFNYMIGLDWFGDNNWMISSQLNMEIINEVGLNSTLATLRVSKKLFDESLNLSDFCYFHLNENFGWFNRFTADYSLTDNIHIIGGFDSIGGKDGIFSLYKNNSEFWLKFKLVF